MNKKTIHLADLASMIRGRIVEKFDDYYVIKAEGESVADIFRKVLELVVEKSEQPEELKTIVLEDLIPGYSKLMSIFSQDKTFLVDMPTEVCVQNMNAETLKSVILKELVDTYSNHATKKIEKVIKISKENNYLSGIDNENYTDKIELLIDFEGYKLSEKIDSPDLLPVIRLVLKKLRENLGIKS